MWSSLNSQQFSSVQTLKGLFAQTNLGPCPEAIHKQKTNSSNVISFPLCRGLPTGLKTNLCVHSF